jgi:hypothetical protein
MVSSAFGSGLAVEELKEIFFALKREDIMQTWYEAGGPLLGVFRPHPNSPLIERLPVKRLEECRIPVAVSVFEYATCSTKVFREGVIKEVVTASCSVPVLVTPATIGHAGGYADGGCGDIGGLAAVDISSGERVLYHHCTEAPLTWATSVLTSPAAGATGPITLQLVEQNVTIVSIGGLPAWFSAVTPFTMERGRIAFESAYSATKVALHSRRTPKMNPHAVVPQRQPQILARL